MDVSREELHRMMEQSGPAEPVARRLGTGDRSRGVTETTRDEVRYLYEAATARMDARGRILASLPSLVSIERKTLLLLVGLVFLSGGISGYAAKKGGGGGIPAEEAPVVMIELRNGRTFQAPAEEAARLERDHDARVVKAMWCPACGKWQPIPPPETYENSRWQRPVCKVHASTPLQAAP